MRRVTERIKSLASDERGANAVLIAMLFVPMMAFGALALDVSAQHAEHTQLQHGADAAALAIAASCAKNEVSCAGSAQAIGNEYVEDNGVTPVPGGAEIDELDIAENYLRVSGAAVFPHFFASLIDGDEDPDSTTVRATSEAEWGSPESGETIPLAVAECELSRHFDPGTETTGEPFILRLIPPGGGGGAKTPTDCAPGYPGGFGWLHGDDTDGDGTPDCTVNIEVGVPELGVPGRSDTKAGGCPDDYIADLIGKTVLIPLYNSYTPGSAGSDGSFNINRFAAFKVTGYHVPSGKCLVPPNVKVGGNCYLPGAKTSPGFAGGEFGLQGYFVRYVEIGEDFDLGDSSPDGGLMVVRLIG